MALREVVKLVVEGEDKASKELKKAEKATVNLRGAVQRFTSFMKSPAGIAAVVGSAVTALAAFTRATANAAERMGLFADQVNLPVGPLSEYAAVARRAGIEQSQFEQIIQRGQRRLEEFAKGTGEAKKTFEEFGLTSEGVRASGQNFLDLLPFLADRFRDLAQEGRGTAEMMKLVDSEGVPLLRVLRDGSAALREAQMEVRGLNATITPEMVQAAKAFNTAMTDMEIGIEGLRNRAFTPLIDRINEYIDRIEVSIEKQKEFARQLGLIGSTPQDFPGAGALFIGQGGAGVSTTTSGRTRARDIDAEIRASIERREGPGAGTVIPAHIFDNAANTLAEGMVVSFDKSAPTALEPIRLSSEELSLELRDGTVAVKDFTQAASFAAGRLQSLFQSLLSGNPRSARDSLLGGLFTGFTTLLGGAFGGPAGAAAGNAAGNAIVGPGGGQQGNNPNPNLRQAANSRRVAESSRRAQRLGGV